MDKRAGSHPVGCHPLRPPVHCACVLEAMNQAEVGALKGCNLCKRGLEHDCSGSSPGLEQEFFLMDEAGVLPIEPMNSCMLPGGGRSGRSHPDYFAPEWVKNMIEITPPAYSLSQIWEQRFPSNLKLALQVGREMSLRLYPLSSSLGEYQTTEADILQEFAPATGEISRDEGLRLVPQCCDKLEEQVSSLISISNRDL